MEKKTIKWINCAKFMAIFAVLINHTKDILYTNGFIAGGGYYSITLFILVSGMLSYKTLSGNENDSVLRSCKKLCLAYLLAVFIYYVATFHYFNLLEYIQYVIRFNISGPFYYVALYIQLMLIRKILFNVLNKMPCRYTVPFEILTGMIILCICSWTTNYTNILDIILGGGKLFGGTYLFIFYLGMIFARHQIFDKISMKKSLIFAAVCIPGYYITWRFLCINNFELDAKLPFGAGFNPPGVSLLMMSLTVLGLSYGVFTLLERNKYTTVISNIASWIGGHTLYIFLYHMFLLAYILERHTSFRSMFLKRIVYLAVMILAPILFEYIVLFIKNILRSKPTVCDKTKEFG